MSFLVVETTLLRVSLTETQKNLLKSLRRKFQHMPTANSMLIISSKALRRGKLMKLLAQIELPMSARMLQLNRSTPRTKDGLNR